MLRVEPHTLRSSRIVSAVRLLCAFAACSVAFLAVRGYRRRVIKIAKRKCLADQRHLLFLHFTCLALVVDFRLSSPIASAFHLVTTGAGNCATSNCTCTSSQLRVRRARSNSEHSSRKSRRTGRRTRCTSTNTSSATTVVKRQAFTVLCEQLSRIRRRVFKPRIVRGRRRRNIFLAQAHALQGVFIVHSLRVVGPPAVRVRDQRQRGHIRVTTKNLDEAVTRRTFSDRPCVGTSQRAWC